MVSDQFYDNIITVLGTCVTCPYSSGMFLSLLHLKCLQTVDPRICHPTPWFWVQNFCDLGAQAIIALKTVQVLWPQ